MYTFHFFSMRIGCLALGTSGDRFALGAYTWRLHFVCSVVLLLVDGCRMSVSCPHNAYM